MSTKGRFSDCVGEPLRRLVRRGLADPTLSVPVWFLGRVYLSHTPLDTLLLCRHPSNTCYKYYPFVVSTLGPPTPLWMSPRLHTLSFPFSPPTVGTYDAFVSLGLKAVCGPCHGARGGYRGKRGGHLDRWAKKRGTSFSWVYGTWRASPGGGRGTPRRRGRPVPLGRVRYPGG